jgi:glycosyltransferase involved in cell wall biosynthesis
VGPAAYLRGARIIRKRRPAVIYSTGGANSAHWAAEKLARRFDLPWIAEIHDPMGIAGAEGPRQQFAYELEGRICDRADVAIWFTEEALAVARARHPALAERGHAMVPGADAPHVERIPYRRGAKFVIGHFGSLSPTRHLGVVAQALQRLIVQDPALANILRLEIYGSDLDSVSREALRGLPAGMVETKGRLERDPATGESGRDRVVRRMNAVDCLLLLHGTEPFCAEYIPSKMYEYLWARRPIVALVWRNPQMTRMLNELGHIPVGADDVNGSRARWPRSSRAGGMASSSIPGSPRRTRCGPRWTSWWRGAAKPPRGAGADGAPRMNGLSVVIITRDEEAAIGAALDSVAFADEIVLVDSGSRDRTVRSRERGARR